MGSKVTLRVKQRAKNTMEHECRRSRRDLLADERMLMRVEAKDETSEAHSRRATLHSTDRHSFVASALLALAAAVVAVAAAPVPVAPPAW